MLLFLWNNAIIMIYLTKNVVGVGDRLFGIFKVLFVVKADRNEVNDVERNSLYTDRNIRRL